MHVVLQFTLEVCVPTKNSKIISNIVNFGGLRSFKVI